MNHVIFRRVAAGAVAAGMGVAVLGVGASGAYATTTKAKSAHGTISSVTAKSDKLVVKVGKKSDTFKTTSKTKVDLNAKKSSLSKLKAGDTATVDYTISGKTLTATTIDAKS